MYEKKFIHEQIKRIVFFKEDGEILKRGYVPSATNVFCKEEGLGFVNEKWRFILT